MPPVRSCTHQAHYQGGVAVRMALGEPLEPDYRALPRATYTDPEAASVGLTLDQARDAGLDAFELVAKFATTARGYAVQATIGHVSIVVNRATRELVGAAMACPTPRLRSTSVSWRSRPISAWTSSPRRSMRFRPRHGSSTDCLPTPGGNWARGEALRGPRSLRRRSTTSKDFARRSAGNGWRGARRGATGAGLTGSALYPLGGERGAP